MNKRLEKILEPIVVSGMVVFLGIVFLIETIDLFLIRPIFRLFKKKKRRRRRVGTHFLKSFIQNGFVLHQL